MPEPDLIPLYLGITGHRDIRDEDKPRLKEIIKKIIRDKIGQCPNTPVVVLTPLAEGADRLAATAAIECGTPYIAPLPMPVDEYRKDFTAPDSLKEFNELLEKADFWFELQLPPGTHLEELQEKDKRDDQYYRIGSYIARQSQLLIALWDGIDNKKKGGTAHIVNLKRSGLPTLHPHFKQRLKNLQTGPILHILTARKDFVPSGDLFRARMIWSDYWGKDNSASAETNDKFLVHLDAYNRDVKRLVPGLQDKIAVTEGNLVIPEENIKYTPLLRRIARCHAVTDALAGYFQARRFFALKVLLVLAVIAFLFFQVYVEFWHKPAILLLYPLTMGVGALWFLHANRKRFEQKHEDYRALSEAYRVQYFLTITEISANVSEYYLQKHKGELEWVIYALRASLLKSRVPETIPDTGNTIGKYNYIRDNWVIDQMSYYKKTSRNYHHHLKKLRRFANWLFLGALGSAVLLFLFAAFIEHLAEWLKQDEEFFHAILVVCTHSFLIISAAILGYNEKMVFEEQARTCQQMFQLFNIANEKLGLAIESGKPEEAREIVWELALESLMENADWLLLHRSRPMEIPKG